MEAGKTTRSQGEVHFLISPTPLTSRTCPAQVRYSTSTSSSTSSKSRCLFFPSCLLFQGDHHSLTQFFVSNYPFVYHFSERPPLTPPSWQHHASYPHHHSHWLSWLRKDHCDSLCSLNFPQPTSSLFSKTSSATSPSTASSRPRVPSPRFANCSMDASAAILWASWAMRWTSSGKNGILIGSSSRRAGAPFQPRWRWR